MRHLLKIILRLTCSRCRRAKWVWGLLFRAKGNRWHVIGTQNVLGMQGAHLKCVRFDISGKDNQICIGPGTTLGNSEVFVRGNGNKVTIGESCRLHGLSIWIEDDSCHINIGNHTTIEGSTHLAATENGSAITIGADCMFAQDIQVRTGDSHSILDAATGQRINRAASVVIGDHVWIAPRVTILKGVVIESGSVVGTGSCVTRSVPANSIAVGVPATVRRSGVRWLRERV